MTAETVQIQRADESLRFVGALLRVNIAEAWKLALPQLSGVQRFDLTAISRVDSAGVALLAALAAHAARAGANDVVIDGNPPGLAELRGAYRLTPALTYAA